MAHGLASAKGGAAASVLGAEREAADPAVLEQTNAPLGSAVRELRHVDVAVELGGGAERHRAQRPESCQDRLLQQQLLARLSRCLLAHHLVARLPTRERLDMLPQRLLAAGSRAPPPGRATRAEAGRGA